MSLPCPGLNDRERFATPSHVNVRTVVDCVAQRSHMPELHRLTLVRILRSVHLNEVEVV